MANISVLEGKGKFSQLKRYNRYKKRSCIRTERDGSLHGFSLNPMKAVRAVSHSVANVARATQKNVIRPASHVVATASRATGHAVAQTARVTTRVMRRAAKGVIRAVAKSLLLKGDYAVALLGESESIARVSKTAAKGVLLPAATAAVAASPAAVASPLVPVLVNEVIDEVYAAIEKKVRQGLSPEQAKKQISDALTRNDDDELNTSPSWMPWAIGGGFILAIVGIMRNR